jgi:hypothetical protein
MTGRARGLLAIWIGGGLATVAALSVAAIMALFGASASCLGATSGALAAGPTPGGKAAHEIPGARLRWFAAAGRRFDVSWPFLASIGVQECGYDGHCGVAPSGCAGVMEIAYVRGSACSPDPSAPTLWERFGIDADGNGLSIFDPADAILTAARIFHADLGAPPAGGPYQGYYRAACRYYGACSDGTVDYAREVMARAVSFGFGREGRVAARGHGPGPVRHGPACGGPAASASGASGTAIVRIARSQLSVSEHPPGSNCTRYGPCEEWCALFVAWVWEHAGIRMQGGTAPYAYSGSFYGWVKEHGGRVLPSGATPSPGDAVLYGRGPRASAHVGIVESVLGGEITTIDGNFADRVARVGPFPPALAELDGEPGPIYAYAEPPDVGRGGEGSRS